MTEREAFIFCAGMAGQLLVHFATVWVTGWIDRRRRRRAKVVSAIPVR